MSDSTRQGRAGKLYVNVVSPFLELADFLRAFLVRRPAIILIDGFYISRDTSECIAVSMFTSPTSHTENPACKQSL